MINLMFISGLVKANQHINNMVSQSFTINWFRALAQFLIYVDVYIDNQIP